MKKVELEKRAEKWQQMPRSSQAELLLADQYYDDQVLPLVAGKLCSEYGKSCGCDVLFMTLGTSWQPLALSIMLHKPQYVVFLTTDDVASTVQNVMDFVNLSALKYVVELVDKGCSDKLISAVRKQYAMVPECCKCAFDITGGTKAMVAAGAMIAENLGMDVDYLENQYIPLLRRPKPGSEKLVRLTKPEQVA